MSSQIPSAINQDAQAIWQAGVDAVDARKLVSEFVSVTENRIGFGDEYFEIDQFNRIVVLGAGKASGWMAEGFERSLSPKLLDRTIGRINVPDDQIANTAKIEVVGCRPAGNNLPTQRVLDSTAEILKLASNCEADDLCVCLISGGGSALLEKPVGDISLDQFCDVTSLLSHQGATIEELNLVRRQLSQVKGGGLARTVNARNVVTLIVSDVIGDRLDIIASGPTVCDSKDVGQRELNAKAKAILLKFDPDLDNVPSAIMAVLNSNSGSSSNGNESGDEGGDASSVVETSVRNIVIGNNETAVAAAVAKATELGYACESETNELDGDVEMLAEKFAGRLFNQLIKSSRDLGETSSRELSSGSRCFISGGEPTVTIDSESGQGGRNQHLTLATMLKFIAQKGESKNPIVTESEGCSGEQFCFLSAGTDGEDGNVAVAGAQFDQALVDKVMQANLSSKAINSLQSFDSYSFLDRVGAIIKMASTRTNVCDLRVVISRFPKHSSDLPLR